jgi:tetratricopeptide (TPR) repeat protein
MSNAAKLKKRAADFEQRKLFDKALQLYIQALQEAEGSEEDDDVALYNRVGDLLMRAGNINEALNYYEKAADLYAERGFLNNAIALCNKILRQSPSRASVYYKLGRISATKGFKSDAKKNFLEYADRMQKSGRLDEAFRALKEFADLCPDQDDIRLMLAEQLSREGRKEEALDQLQRLHGKLEAEGRTTEARATLDRMKAIDPEFTPASSTTGMQAGGGDLVFLDLSDDAPRTTGAERQVGGPALAPVPPVASDTFLSSEGKASANESNLGGLELILPDDLGPPLVDAEPIEVVTTALAAPSSPAVDALDGLELTSFAAPTPPTPIPDAFVPEALAIDSGDAGVPRAPTPANRATDVLDDALLDLDAAGDSSMVSATSDVPGEGFLDLSIDAPSASETGIDADAPEATAAEPLEIEATEIEALEIGSTDIASLAMEPPADRGEPATLLRAEAPGNWGIDVANAHAPPSTEGYTLEASLEAALAASQRDDDEAMFDDGPSAASAVSADADAARAEALEFGGFGGDLLGETSRPEDRSPATDPSSEAIAGVFDLGPAGELLAGGADQSSHTPVEGDFDFPPPAFAIAPVPDGYEPGTRPLSDSPIDAFDGLGLVEGAESLAEHAEAVSREAGEDRADAWLSASEDTMLGDDTTIPRTDTDGAETTSGGGTQVSTPHAYPAELSEVVESRDLDRFDSHPAAVNYAAMSTSEFEVAPVSPQELAEAAAALVTPSDAPVVDDARVESLQARLANGPSDWALRRELAEALFERGRREEGLAELEGAMVGLDLEGRYDDALTLIQELLALEPDSVRLLQKRVEFAARLGDRAGLVDAYVALADGLFRTGEPDKSSVVYQRVLELSPDEPRALAGMNAAGFTPPEPSLAVPSAAPAAPPPPVAAHWSEDAEVAPPPSARAPAKAPAAPASPDSFVDLGDLLREDDAPRSTRMVTAEKAPTGDEQADFEEMLRRFKQGVAENVDEEDYESHYDLGVAYKEMGLMDEAIAEFQKALRGSHGRTRAYEALGQCFVEKEQFQVASSVLRRALTLPEATDDHILVGVLYLLGQSCEALGRPAESLDFYRRVFAVDIQFRDVADRITAMERLPQ